MTSEPQQLDMLAELEAIEQGFDEWQPFLEAQAAAGTMSTRQLARQLALRHGKVCDEGVMRRVLEEEARAGRVVQVGDDLWRASAEAIRELGDVFASWSLEEDEAA